MPYGVVLVRVYALLVDDLKQSGAGDHDSHRTLVRSQNFAGPVREPTRRIRNARQKLDGFSPVALLVDDLKQNPAVDKFNSLAALEAILRRGCPWPARAVAARSMLCCLCFELILHGADLGGKPRRGEEWVRVASNPKHSAWRLIPSTARGV